MTPGCPAFVCVVSLGIAVLTGCEPPADDTSPKAAPKESEPHYELEVGIARHQRGTVQFVVEDRRPVKAILVTAGQQAGITLRIPLTISEFRAAGPDAYFKTTEMAEAVTDAKTGRYLVLDFTDEERRGERPFVRCWAPTMFQKDFERVYMSSTPGGNVSAIVRCGSEKAKEIVTTAEELRMEEEIQDRLDRGALRVTGRLVRFAEISNWNESSLRPISAELRALDGKLVTMVGFPLSTGGDKGKQFLLVCSPSRLPNRHDTSGVVDVVSRGEIKLRSRPVRVEGRFRARVDAEGMVSDVFQILDAKVTDFK